MSEYTPTLGRVRAVACGGATPLTDAEFDRWLAQHDAEVGEKVARNLARIAEASREQAETGTGSGFERAVLLANARCFDAAANVAREVTS